MLKASDETTVNPDEMLGEHCQRMGLWQVSIMDLGAAICSVQARIFGLCGEIQKHRRIYGMFGEDWKS